MKKIWLIAFIFNGLIFFSSAQTIENNFIVSADNNLFDLTTNLKIKFPLLQINTSFSKDKFNFGLSLSDEKLNKPLLFTVKTGNLTTSGILSSLNNPLLSSYISPFSNPDLQIRQIISSMGAIRRIAIRLPSQSIRYTTASILSSIQSYTNRIIPIPA